MGDFFHNFFHIYWSRSYKNKFPPEKCSAVVDFCAGQLTNKIHFVGYDRAALMHGPILRRIRSDMN
ncbi:hypothetical protein SAMN05880558_114108 [Aeromonas sp. RU39B]|nr:hypothetical protein SAMN05880558_114108 [Aeromonas sp. RU39B]